MDECSSRSQYTKFHTVIRQDTVLREIAKRPTYWQNNPQVVQPPLDSTIDYKFRNVKKILLLKGLSVQTRRVGWVGALILYKLNLSGQA